MSDFQYFLKGLWATAKGALIIPLGLYGIASSPIFAPILAFSGPNHDFSLWTTITLAPGALLWVIGLISLAVEGIINKGKEVALTQSTSNSFARADHVHNVVDYEKENAKLKQRIKELEDELADRAILGGKP